jgi:Resolvase, N terminal domain
MHRCPDYAAFCWPEVSHNLSGKLCPIYLGLDKIRDVRIGYARVSTDDQTLDLQRDALKHAKCREIYEEQAIWRRPSMRTTPSVCIARITSGTCNSAPSAENL